MSDLALALYHRAPYPLKVGAASLQGLRLRRWRYDGSTDERVAAALARERWSVERWRAWREERLAHVLERASTRVPFYRDAWSERVGDRSGDPTSLADWPLLEKETLRASPERLVADDVAIDRLYAESSSGSTGTPVRLWWSRETVRAWYALFEARCRRWYGVSRRDRWAILGGRLVASERRRRPPYWVWSAPLRQLYLSTLHLSPSTGGDYVEAMRRHRVRHVYGYPSALHALAVAAAEGSVDPRTLGLEVVVTNAEPLYAHQRRAIESVFGCPVRETYGMAELVAAASECEHGRLHLWPEVGVVETLENAGEGDQEADQEGGELIATGLLNDDQPLIRYRVGDRVRVASSAVEPCRCGRTLPVLESIEGRVDDVIVTPDGRSIGRLDPVFKGDFPVREAQIVQEAIDRLRLRIVPAPRYTDAVERQLVARLRERVGRELSIEVERCEALERGANGKLRGVVSRIGGGQDG